MYRSRLARHFNEDFNYKFSQKDFEGSCPVAAAKYDLWSNSKMAFSKPLAPLVDYLNSAGVLSPGYA